MYLKCNQKARQRLLPREVDAGGERRQPQRPSAYQPPHPLSASFHKKEAISALAPMASVL